MYCVNTEYHWINESNKDFSIAIRDSIFTKDMLNNARKLYEGNTDVVEFNRNNLFIR